MAAFGTWNFFDGALESRSSGHHFSETKALSDELVRRGKTVRLYCYRDPPAGRFPGAETIPTFSVSPYISLSNDPVWSAMENFIVHNRVFDRDLQRLDAASFHNGLAVFPTIDLWQLMGLLRWLGRFDASVRPKAAVNLFPMRDRKSTRLNSSH